MNDPLNYEIFFKFIKANIKNRFDLIDREDNLTLQLARTLEHNSQILQIGDMTQLKFLFCCSRSHVFFGVKPEDLNPAVFLEKTHPDDMKRHLLARSFLIKSAHDLFEAGKGDLLLSSNIRIRNQLERYSKILFQNYLFHSSHSHKTVYLLQVMTDITSDKTIKHGYHYYVGHDLSHFRYPDKNLLSLGNVFSRCEFEVIKLIAAGYNSDEIGKKIFNSTNTINTHRRNILKKTGKASLYEVIQDLRERGLL